MSVTSAVSAWPGGEVQKRDVVAARQADVNEGRLQFLRRAYISRASAQWEGDDTGCLAVHILGFKDAARIDSPSSTESLRDLVDQALGWPSQYSGVRMELFERLSPQMRANWSLRSLEAIPVGVNLRQVIDRLILDIVSDDAEIGVQRFDPGPAVPALQMVHALYRRRLEGDEPSSTDWGAAASAVPTAKLTPTGFVAGYALRASAGVNTLNLLLRAIAASGETSDQYISAAAERLVAHTATLPVKNSQP